ncbi:hypothetical protein [Streptomyces sp. bgisy060]|uniref:hypothetical protein n=1 Tax=Streptomyces sp. bgisy060 TaxID=3413775 RepID=UPI003EBFD92B
MTLWNLTARAPARRVAALSALLPARSCTAAALRRGHAAAPAAISTGGGAR